MFQKKRRTGFAEKRVAGAIPIPGRRKTHAWTISPTGLTSTIGIGSRAPGWQTEVGIALRLVKTRTLAKTARGLVTHPATNHRLHGV